MAARLEHGDRGIFTGCAAAGGSKVDAPEAGKPELPQQEPAVGPGQKVDIPESKDEAPLPKADAQAIPDDQGKLIVTVPKSFEQDGLVYVVKTPFKFGDDFEKALKGNQKFQAEKEVYVHADQDLRYSSVVKVMAALSRNGGEKTGLVTDPLK